MSRARATLLALALLTLAAPAGAGDFGRRGFYLGVAGAYGLEAFDIKELTGGIVEVENSWGLNARAGYRLLSFLALEAQYEWMQRFDGKLLGTEVVTLTTHTPTANLKLLLPIWRFQPYLLGGVGGTYLDFQDKTPGNLIDNIAGIQDGWSFAGRAALGLDLYVTEHLLVNGEVAGVLSTADFTGISSLPYVSFSVGLQYRF